MSTDALREATQWCRDHLAKVTWSEDESRCRVEVILDGRAASARVWGEGTEFIEAYQECRALVEEYFDGPPTRPLDRLG